MSTTAEPLDKSTAEAQARAAKLAAATFGELVSLLVRSPSHNANSIKDLEWLLLPAIMNRSFAIAQAQLPGTGAMAPVGAVLWASVSDEVDQRLSDSQEHPIRLQPADWRSGNVLWIMEVLGDRRAVNGVVDKLMQTVFKDKVVKMRSKTPDGKIIVGVVTRATPAEAAAAGGPGDAQEAIKGLSTIVGNSANGNG